VLYIALAAIYLFSFSVSVSISRQYRRNARLAQELALMDMRLRELERRLAEQNSSP
jgi:HAMP domain-containing protein